MKTLDESIHDVLSHYAYGTTLNYPLYYNDILASAIAIKNHWLDYDGFGDIEVTDSGYEWLKKYEEKKK